MIEEPIRIKQPKPGEILGIVESKLGGNKLRVRCQDEKIRLCRIPGRIRKKIWIKEGDVILIKPWDIQGDQKADVLYRYTYTQVSWLRKRGILKID